MRKLLVVSDTPIWRYENQWYVHGPTLREIEQLKVYFDKVIWIGYLQKGAPSGIASISNTNITFETLLPSGGSSIRNKLLQIILIPWYTLRIYLCARSSSYIHARGPSVPAIIVCLMSKLFLAKKKLWFKYAGNWVQSNKPLLYRIQTYLYLRAKNARVSVNGSWPETPPHIYTFPNPSFNREEFLSAQYGLKDKDFGTKKDIIFVGRLDSAKGVMRLIEAIKGDMSIFNSVNIVGDGLYKNDIKEKCKNMSNLFLHGNLGRDDLFTLYSKCHFIVLPTLSSEGFPKVIAEAAIHGCIPIVTALSSIDQYVENEFNGFLMSRDIVNTSLKQYLLEIINRNDLSEIAKQSRTTFSYFSYQSYLDHLRLIGFIE